MLVSENQIRSELKKTCMPEAWAWLTAKEEEISQIGPDSLMTLDIALSMTRRKVGDQPLAHFVHLNVAECARILLLLRAVNNPNVSEQNLIQRAYQQGDEYEKEAILKGLSLLDSSGEQSALVVDACRTNILTMMSAIAFNNEYPANYFAEREFNQMVLKCIFMDFDISAVSGLNLRRNVQLSKMCVDYVLECLPADRPFPPSIWLAVCVKDIPDHIDVVLDFLICEDIAHRQCIVNGLHTDTDTQKRILTLAETAELTPLDKEYVDNVDLKNTLRTLLLNT